MANPEHLAKLKGGVEAWNRWRRENRGVRPDLSDAFLEGANLSSAFLRGALLSRASLAAARLWGADLAGCDLRSADLRSTDLAGAFLRRADIGAASLRGADLSNADLSDADLSNADLSEADLSNAKLGGTNLSSVRLQGARLENAHLNNTHLHRVDLREAKALDLVRHLGPSAVGPQTLEVSQGQIPDAFLKGCGFPDWAIESAKLYNPDLREDEITDITYAIHNARGRSPIVPLSVFLSYSHEDAAFVEKIEKRLDGDGIRSWRDTHDMVAGPLEPQIDSAITAQRAVLLVLSENSVVSDWVPWELDRARKAEEAAGGYKICPVSLDDSWKDCRWPDRVISYLKDRYYVLPLHDWEDGEVFEPQYQKLKKGLGIYYRSEGEG